MWWVYDTVLYFIYLYANVCMYSMYCTVCSIRTHTRLLSRVARKDRRACEFESSGFPPCCESSCNDMVPWVAFFCTHTHTLLQLHTSSSTMDPNEKEGGTTTTTTSCLSPNGVVMTSRSNSSSSSNHQHQEEPQDSQATVPMSNRARSARQPQQYSTSTTVSLQRKLELLERRFLGSPATLTFSPNTSTAGVRSPEPQERDNDHTNASSTNSSSNTTNTNTTALVSMKDASNNYHHYHNNNNDFVHSTIAQHLQHVLRRTQQPPDTPPFERSSTVRKRQPSSTPPPQSLDSTASAKENHGSPTCHTTGSNTSSTSTSTSNTSTNKRLKPNHATATTTSNNNNNHNNNSNQSHPNSRNPTTTTRTSHKQQRPIHQFFAPVTVSSSTLISNPSSSTAGTSSSSSTAPNATSATSTTTNNNNNKTSNSSSQPPPSSKHHNTNHTTSTAALQAQIQQLQQQVQDQQSQLQAVSNNRSILHDALQQQLLTLKTQHAQTKEQHQLYQRQVLLQLQKTTIAQIQYFQKEKSMRMETLNQRIGRMPQNRDEWVPGTAFQELQQERDKLKQQKINLEERQSHAKKQQKKLSKTTLESREAIESVRFHLQNLKKQEKYLQEQALALQNEKLQHIQNVKQLWNEQASRFKYGETLNDKYILRQLIGKGGFSEVWDAYDIQSMEWVAVKIHQLDPRWSTAKKDNYIKHVSREYDIHRSVRHERIVSLMDVFEIDNHSFATVLELCECDLDRMLKERGKLCERDARSILLQILVGMNYLSHADGDRQGIIHYDLKPANILFDKVGDAKITDFGLSKILEENDSDSMELTSQGAGTYWYLPPECFVTNSHGEGGIRISNKVDVWSIGVIFYQMLYGKRPFGEGKSQESILNDQTMLNAHKVIFPDKPDVSKLCKEFIEACLTYDPNFRPSMGQLCQHPYIISSST